ncbi:MAG: exodeoxyribonuclease VII large subunit [Anaeromyxobacter sp.]|nr:exodeoxyribonuclease VII large subunit [Anaeromyxobacter sp.]
MPLGETYDLFAARRAVKERKEGGEGATPTATPTPTPTPTATATATSLAAEPTEPTEPAGPLTVLALTQALKGCLEPRFRDVWVAGEISNYRAQASGHLYFSLKDEGATLPCAMWAGQARRLRFAPAEGLEVVARGRVELYPPHGKYQLIVDALEPRGAGALALQLEQVKARLAADGLLDPARKRPLPFLARRIGLATSPTTAALRDFLRVLHGRFPGLPVLLAPCRVQGEGAAATVIAAIQALARQGVDVIVVTRGGGSVEDLWAFNDERLARAIAASPVPVVSAVGHETDVSVADLVADVRAATPTHAAQLLAPVRDDLVAGLAALRGRLRRAMGAAVEGRRATLRALSAELADPAHAVSAQRHRLEDLVRRAEAAALRPAVAGRARLEALRVRLARGEPRARLRALRARVELARRGLEGWRAATFRREQLRVERLAARLEPANVAKLLSRGFALALHRGRLVARSGEVAPGDELRVALGEGWLDARVTARDAGDDPVPGRGHAPSPGGPVRDAVASPGRRG